MAIGTTNIGATPCCGVIQRTWECLPDEASQTGLTHNPGGDYAPDFEREQAMLDRGICPDCKQSFRPWLRENGGRETADGWRWDYGAAERAYARSEATRRLAGRLEELLGES